MLVTGFITYNESTVKYLADFLPSLKAALDLWRANSGDEYEIINFDNSTPGHLENRDYIKKNFPDIRIVENNANIGFARAYNSMIRAAVLKGADYFFMVNPDITLALDSIWQMFSEIIKDEKIAGIAPRILKWNFSEKKLSDIIDSDGLYMTKAHRFCDRHQGLKLNEVDQKVEAVFGFTGAAVLLRIKALEDVAWKFNNNFEFLDELMFMYKEDADLSYRLQLAAWKIIFCPQALVYHDRTANPLGESSWQIIANRRLKSRHVKEWSFMNQLVVYNRYRRLRYSAQARWQTTVYHWQSLIYVLVFESYLIPQIVKFWRAKKIRQAKRRALVIRVAPQDLEKRLIY